MESHFTEIAWRTFDIGTMTAEGIGWLAIFIGIGGYSLTKTNPKANRRYLGLLIGGITTLVTNLVITHIYSAVTYVMTGQTGGINHREAMYPDSLISTIPAGSEVFFLSGILSQVGAIIGMTAVSFGVALWGITKKRSRYNSNGKRILYSGIALMMASMAERVMSAVVYVIFC